jgi:hypothetical protein
MLGDPASPVSRFSSAVGHSNDFNATGSFSIHEIEREAVENITPSAMHIPWPHLGVDGYCFNSQI